jgi:hypothetical protein
MRLIAAGWDDRPPAEEIGAARIGENVTGENNTMTPQNIENSKTVEPFIRASFARCRLELGFAGPLKVGLDFTHAPSAGSEEFPADAHFFLNAKGLPLSSAKHFEGARKRLHVWGCHRRNEWIGRLRQKFY